MVHSFFETIASEPSLANQCAERASHNHRPTRSFTQVFSIFFPEDGELDSDVETWLQVIAEGFEFDKKKEKRFTIWEVEKLFRRYGFHPKDPDNVHAFNFWLYLIWIYKKLLQSDYDRNDNIFRFMEGCSIYNVKVVIMGNDPCKDVPSSGYAFHKSVCPSTEKILDFVDTQIDAVCHYLEDNRSLSLSNRELLGAKRNCNLWGWIEQGVLLLNSRLTFGVDGDEDIQEGWELFTDFILEYLSDEVGNVVFLLLGNANSEKGSLINQDRNLVMNLYHPAHYTYSPGRFVRWNIDWKTMLPFINASFYLWQSSGRDVEYIIDWSSVGWKKKRRARRIKQWNEFFEDVRDNCGFIERGSSTYFQNYLVRRSERGVLTLESHSSED